MNKKAKLICYFIFLIILIIIMLIILNTNTLNYVLNFENKKFKINQVKQDGKYSLEIKYKDKIYNYEDLKVDTRNRRIVNKIYFYGDSDNNYYCLLPIIDNKVLFDISCYKDDILYNYHDIVGKNDHLDNYVNTIKQYDVSLYYDEISKYNMINNIKFFNNNNTINKNVVVTTYNGIISNNKIIKLFKKDVYNNRISAFVGNYYVIANYDSEYEFEYFYIIDLDTNKVEKIKCPNAISFDSYIQGIVDDIIYLYDKDNESQYQIDPLNKTIKYISSTKIDYYKNNNWQKISPAMANKELLFDYSDLSNDFSDYDKVVKTDKYYYLFKKVDGKYNLYRVNKKNIDVLRYILTLDTTNVYFNDDFIYYMYDQKLYLYSDEIGLKTLIEYSELNFNNTIKYYIY